MDTSNDSSDSWFTFSHHNSSRSKSLKKLSPKQRLGAKRNHSPSFDFSDSDSDFQPSQKWIRTRKGKRNHASEQNGKIDYSLDFESSDEDLINRRGKRRSMPWKDIKLKSTRLEVLDEDSLKGKRRSRLERNRKLKLPSNLESSDEDFLEDTVVGRNEVKSSQLSKRSKNVILEYGGDNLPDHASDCEETLLQKVHNIAPLIHNENEDQGSDESRTDLPSSPRKNGFARPKLFSNEDSSIISKSIENSISPLVTGCPEIKLKPCTVCLPKLSCDTVAVGQSSPPKKEACNKRTDANLFYSHDAGFEKRNSSDSLSRNIYGDLVLDSENCLISSPCELSFHSYLSSDSNGSSTSTLSGDKNLEVPLQNAGSEPKVPESNIPLYSFLDLETAVKEEIMSGSESSRSTVVLDESLMSHDLADVPDPISKSPEAVARNFNNHMFASSNLNVPDTRENTNLPNTIEFGSSRFKGITDELRKKYNLKPCEVKIEKILINNNKDTFTVSYPFKIKPHFKDNYLCGDTDADNENQNNMNSAESSDFQSSYPKCFSYPCSNETASSSKDKNDILIDDTSEKVFFFRSRSGIKYLVKTSCDGEERSMYISFECFSKFSSKPSEKANPPSRCRFGCTDIQYKCIHWKWNLHKPITEELPTTDCESIASDVSLRTDGEAPTTKHQIENSHSSLSAGLGFNASNDFVCVCCKSVFKNVLRLYRHTCEGKKREGHICYYCERIFSSTLQFEKHKETHSLS